jgi:D-alanyl-D-alanine carboxypeptidase
MAITGRAEGLRAPRLESSLKRRGLLCLSGLALIAATTLGRPAAGADNHYGTPPVDIERHLGKLAAAYSGIIAQYDSRFVVLKNGTKYPVSDGKTQKTFEEMLSAPDIDDMFYVAYPAGAPLTPPAKNQDPGRVRFTPLFLAMYGDCTKGEVAGRLRTIRWLPQHDGGTLQVTKVNGVDRALEAVSNEIDRLSRNVLAHVITKASGYQRRSVAGTKNRSMHAYGVAIDLNVKRSDYWRWHDLASPVWSNSMPIEIVRIFEKHGFIWGGRWYHYDTMHFEYRPELIDDGPAENR